VPDLRHNLMNVPIRQISQQTRWDTIPALATWVVEEGIRIQQIAAPTFAEDTRAAYVAQQFRAYGLHDVQIDQAKNAIGRLPGLNAALPAVLISAHTDTVFPAETDLTTRREGNAVFGPGLGDNSLGVSGLLGSIKWLQEQQIQPPCDIWYAATSCEEGLGDLKGIRAAFDTVRDRVALVINLEGLALGHVYHAGIAVHRLHITAHAEGGHSWLHFGRPSAVHGIMELGAQITRIIPPLEPRTTYNIGQIEGGQGINVIGTSAGLWLDLRSEQQSTLERLREQVLKIVDSLSRPGLSFDVKVVGNRPAGSISARHPLVLAALAALEEVNIRGTLENGSTDGNIPLSAGCPTVTIGITRGGNAHRLDEYAEPEHVPAGMRQFLTLLLAACQSIATA
jgi:tripeptide aminopeptidase